MNKTKNEDEASDTMKKYWNEIDKYDLLSSEEEKRLGDILKGYPIGDIGLLSKINSGGVRKSDMMGEILNKKEKK